MDELLVQLKRDEAVMLKPYRDNSEQTGFEGRSGKLTIGIGRNLDDVGLTASEADFLCQNDIERVRANLTQHAPWVLNLDLPRLGVLMNMAFNMGVPGLLAFRKMLACAQAGDFEGWAREMEDSKWFHQVGPRAVRLQKQVLTGEWQ